MSYRITVRRGPKIERERHASLDEALQAIETHAGTAPSRERLEFLSRRFEAHELVAARIELSGEGVRAGLDVHGDGSLTAWTGRIRRTPIEPQSGENAYGALRRTLTA